MKRFAIYLDMDGVLADFDAGLTALGIVTDAAMNRSRKEMSPEEAAAKDAIYDRVAACDFFLNLPPMPGARRLWDFVAEAEPIVLTAAPKFRGLGEGSPAFEKAARDKRAWIHAQFGPIPDERFICTTSSKKALFMHRKHSDHQVLVDDRPSNIGAWRQAGGIGVLHTAAETSIAELAALFEACRAA